MPLNPKEETMILCIAYLTGGVKIQRGFPPFSLLWKNNKNPNTVGGKTHEKFFKKIFGKKSGERYPQCGKRDPQ